MSTYTRTHGYPRLYRLGLIEASDRIALIAFVARGIRGFIASASLKRPIQKILASLYIRYPRLYRLGLIEASTPAPLQIHSRWYPRLYRLGLIEAG